MQREFEDVIIPGPLNTQDRVTDNLTRFLTFVRNHVAAADGPDVQRILMWCRKMAVIYTGNDPNYPVPASLPVYVAAACKEAGLDGPNPVTNASSLFWTMLGRDMCAGDARTTAAAYASLFCGGQVRSGMFPPLDPPNRFGQRFEIRK